MKNKAFTLTELLAVISILTILMGLALIGISRYRIKVEEDDLKYLHSTLETNYNNYRKDTITNNSIPVDSILIDPSDSTYKNYLNGLTYDGKRLSASDINGSVIELHKKGEVLNSAEYKKDTLKRANKLNGTIEDIYVIDATCMVSAYTEGNTIKKTCGNKIEPSIDEIVCIKVRYKDRWIIDDFGNDKNALIVNNLCKYIGG